MTRALPILLAAAAALAPAAPADAQIYRFSVPFVRMQNFIQPDASVRIVYEIRFENAAGVSPIDVVDVGLPHDDYDISNMSASIDGVELGGITRSSYIDVGVEVPLGANAIAPGATGVFRFEATMPDMVYSDTTDPELASFRITPTWFDPGLVTGTTDLNIAVHPPEGVTRREVVHQGDQFSVRLEHEGRVVAGWRIPEARFTEAHPRGVSFPRRVMERVVVVTKLELLARWFENSAPARMISGLALLVLFAIFFLRFTRGTGWSLFIAMFVGFGIWFYLMPRAQLYSIPVWLVVMGLMEWRTQKKRRRYLPPLISAEGGGIKRGLTAPEAAVLLELPLGRVLSLVLFGMLKKRLVTQQSADPLALDVPPALRSKSHKSRRKAAAEMDSLIHAYEHGFLDALAEHRGLDVEEIDFSEAMKALIEHVAKRVEAFDVDETKDYYRSIVARAWTEAKALGEVEQRTRAVDRNLEWLMLDDDWGTSFGRWHTAGYHYHPVWLRADGGGGGLAAVGGGSTTRGGGGASAPSFGDVSASFAGWAENVTGSIADKLSPVSVNPAAGQAVVDLSGADTVTGDILSSFFSGGGGGGYSGGGGGGCACACAGCACACACAGGGR